MLVPYGAHVYAVVERLPHRYQGVVGVADVFAFPN
jgi:hypothetical protein